MRNILPILFSKIRFNNLEEILKVLEKVLAEREIDFYLIGALARDIQLSGKFDIKAPRATHDIDFAILVNEQAGYDQLLGDLKTHYNFEETTEPYRLK